MLLPPLPPGFLVIQDSSACRVSVCGKDLSLRFLKPKVCISEIGSVRWAFVRGFAAIS